MKKTYLARRNALLSAEGVSWSAGALLFAIVVLCLRLLAPNVFWHLFTPVFEVSDSITNSGHAFLAHFENAAALSEQNEKLAAENEALSILNQAQQQKIADQDALLGGPEEHLRPGVLAGVVARPPTSPYDTLVLGKGSGDGVAVGMEAFGSGGVPIGIISSASKDFSQVSLFSTPGLMADGWVGQKSIPVTLVGAGAGAFKATMARAAGIAIGDVVFVPGPGKLPLGSVVRVDSDPLSPSVTLRIVSASNPFSISLVELRSTSITGVSFATSTLP